MLSLLDEVVWCLGLRYHARRTIRYLLQPLYVELAVFSDAVTLFAARVSGGPHFANTEPLVDLFIQALSFRI